MSWSTGKDSAYALHLARAAAELEVVGLLTTVTTAFGRVSMHGVREALLDRQAAALGLPCVTVPIPAPCPDEVYEREMGAALARARADGVTHVVFGDLFLEDLRAYRECRLTAVGMQAVFPLWRRDTCVDPRALDRGFAGRAFDDAFLAELPPSVDPCGERGEFHSFAWGGPMFAQPIAVAAGAVVERDGFVFADVVPA